MDLPRVRKLYAANPEKLVDPTAWPAHRKVLIEGVRTGCLRLRAGARDGGEPIPAVVRMAARLDPPGLWRDDDPRLDAQEAPAGAREFGFAVRRVVIDAAAEVARAGNPAAVMRLARACPGLLLHPQVAPEFVMAFAQILPATRTSRTRPDPDQEAAFDEYFGCLLDLLSAGVPEPDAREYLALLREARALAFRDVPLQELVSTRPDEWPEWSSELDALLQEKLKERRGDEWSPRMARQEVRRTLAQQQAEFVGARNKLAALASPWRDAVIQRPPPGVDDIAAGLRACVRDAERVAEILDRWSPPSRLRGFAGVAREYLRLAAAQRWRSLCRHAGCTHEPVLDWAPDRCRVLRGDVADVEKACDTL